MAARVLRWSVIGGFVAALALAVSCSDSSRGPVAPPEQPATPAPGLQQMNCTVDLASGSMNCEASAARTPQNTLQNVIIGGQNIFTRMISACVRTDLIGVLHADVAVQNLLRQAMGTRDGSTASGITVFFHTGPTNGVTIANADGTDSFTGPNQPFFRYPEMLEPGAVSSPRMWRFNLNGQSTFSFSVFLRTELPDESDVTPLPQPVNRPPTACINQPEDLQGFTQGDEITFRGTAEDPEEGELDGDQVVWTSFPDGVLGTGSEITRSDLSIDTHRITFTATDQQGLQWTSSVQIRVGPPPDNEPPTATITAPEDGAEFTEGEEITFEGSATDPEDGDLSGDALVWTSDIDGEIGTGTSFTRDDLSVGEHTITLTATDSDGLTGTATVQITITAQPGAPTATITAPEDGDEFTEGDEINFAGSATDPEDGDLTGDALVWTSDNDGEIGTGTSFVRDDLSVGEHTITLTATDSEGLTGTASIIITVNARAEPGSITLSAVTVGSGLMVATGGTLSLAAPEGGVTVRVESADPDKLLLSPNAATAGEAAIELMVAAGATNFSFWAHAVEGETGEVTLTGSAADFEDGSATATLVQTRLSFVGLPASIAEDATDRPFRVRVTVPDVTGEQLARRGGGGLEVTVASSNPAAARLVTTAATGASVTVRIPEGANQSPATVEAGGVALDPLEEGTTTISAGAPGAEPSSQQVTVTSTQPHANLVCGDFKSDAIISPADVDQFTFDGSAGQVVTIRVAAQADIVGLNFRWNPRIELYSRAGELLEAANSGGFGRPAEITLTLPLLGRYLINVSDVGADAAGPYGLALVCISDPAGTPISYGQTVTDSITPRGDHDLYTFSGTSGEVVTIRAAAQADVVGLNFRWNPRVELYSQAGELLEAASSGGFGRPAEITLTLPSSGTFGILVSDVGSDATGPYGLAVDRVSDPVGTLISYGQTATDSITPRGDHDLYTFSGTSGEVVTIRAAAQADVVGLNFRWNPRVELYSPAGELLEATSSGGFGRPAEITLTLPSSGTFGILVADVGSDATGPYGLTLERISDPVGTLIGYGQTVTDSITPRGDHDLYTFGGRSGEVVTIRVAALADIVGLNFRWNPRIELYSPAGELLEAVNSGGFGSPAEITLTLPSSGTFGILVSDVGSDATGPYGLTLTLLSSAASAQEVIQIALSNRIVPDPPIAAGRGVGPARAHPVWNRTRQPTARSEVVL